LNVCLCYAKLFLFRSCNCQERLSQRKRDRKSSGACPQIPPPPHPIPPLLPGLDPSFYTFVSHPLYPKVFFSPVLCRIFRWFWTLILPFRHFSVEHPPVPISTGLRRRLVSDPLVTAYPQIPRAVLASSRFAPLLSSRCLFDPNAGNDVLRAVHAAGVSSTGCVRTL